MANWSSDIPNKMVEYVCYIKHDKTKLGTESRADSSKSNSSFADLSSWTLQRLPIL